MAAAVQVKALGKCGCAFVCRGCWLVGAVASALNVLVGRIGVVAVALFYAATAAAVNQRAGLYFCQRCLAACANKALTVERALHFSKGRLAPLLVALLARQPVRGTMAQAVGLGNTRCVRTVILATVWCLLSFGVCLDSQSSNAGRAIRVGAWQIR